MGGKKRLAVFITAHKSRIAEVFTGNAIWHSISWIYDNPIYISVIAYFGMIWGGILMTLGSLSICLGTLVWYNKKGEDWLGVKEVDAIRDIASKYLEKMMTWRNGTVTGKMIFVLMFIPAQLVLMLTRMTGNANHGDKVAFVFLSVFTDPFLTTVYLRHGRFGPMRRRDWSIFLGSVMLSNFYWILRNGAIIAATKAIWQHVMDW